MGLTIVRKKKRFRRDTYQDITRVLIPHVQLGVTILWASSSVIIDVGPGYEML